MAGKKKKQPQPQPSPPKSVVVAGFIAAQTRLRERPLDEAYAAVEKQRAGTRRRVL